MKSEVFVQRMDEAKRRQILTAAVGLFASRPYHDVRLDDIARQSKVGKGTLYVYFESKEQLYASVIVDGLTQLVDQLRATVQPARGNAWASLSLIVRQFVAWAHRFPGMFQLMRLAESSGARPVMRDKRRDLGKLVADVIREGVKTGELCDPHPDLTGQLVPSLVRCSMRYGPANLGQKAIVNHVLRILGSGIRRAE